MKNYIHISPQEVEEERNTVSPFFKNDLRSNSHDSGFNSGVKFATTKANIQLTPILDEAVRVMEGQLKIEKLAAEHLTTDINHQRIADLEKSINNIKALKQ